MSWHVIPIRRAAMIAGIVCVAARADIPPVRADKPQPRSDTPPTPRTDPPGGLATLTNELRRSMDWDEEFVLIEPTIHNMWDRYGWDGEPDRYARDMMLEVARIPPWQVMKRLRRAAELTRDRYDLSPEQIASLERSLILETSGFLLRNAKTLVPHVREMIETRRSGEPFTPEQIARWTREDDAMWSDGRARLERLITDLRATLTPEQRRRFDRDKKAMDKRFDDLDRARRAWAAGRWRAEDWGLQDDPIQSGKARRNAKRDAAGALAALQRAAASKSPGAIPSKADVLAMLNIRWRSYDPTTWHAYVVDVQRRYAMDAGQRDAARSIYTELFDRATTYQTLHTAALSPIPVPQRLTDPAYEPIRAVFAELEARLAALPTQAQRDLAARPAPARAPASTSPQPPGKRDRK
ncbi:MAG: hypothetical protein ACE5E6_03140 [Phycisphaerae bacterium]